MYYEPKTGSIVLKEVEPQDMLQATTIVRDKKKDDEAYEN